MQYRVYDRQTLQYVDGGAVRDYSVDSDYINDNNSVVDIVVATNANIGDIVCLIETSGAYDKGVITAIDNEALTISYKHDKELFNDNILNPFADQFVDDTDIQAVGKFGLDIVGGLIDLYWGRTLDKYKRLPLEISYSGDVLDSDGNPRMLWTWSNTQIKFSEWLVEIFEKYSVVLTWDINFDTAQTALSARKPNYIVHLSAIFDEDEIIKDNVDTQTIKYQTEQQPEATVCIVVDKETKGIAYVASGVNLIDTTYGYEGCYLEDNGGAYDVAKIAGTQPQNSNVSRYVKIDPNTPYTLSMENGDKVPRQICFYNNQKTCIGSLATPYTGQAARFSYGFTTPANAKYLRVCFAGTAKNIQLERGNAATSYDPYNKPAIFYLAFDSVQGLYYTTMDENDENRIMPVKTKYVEYDSQSNTSTTVTDTAVNELTPNTFNQAIEIEIPRDSKMFDFELANYGDVYRIITKNGTIRSIYSGRKESSTSKMVTLLFGLGRKNYTDLIQKSFRIQKYQTLYR